jgi:hypothetical protein
MARARNAPVALRVRTDRARHPAGTKTETVGTVADAKVVRVEAGAGAGRDRGQGQGLVRKIDLIIGAWIGGGAHHLDARGPRAGTGVVVAIAAAATQVRVVAAAAVGVIAGAVRVPVTVAGI